MKKEIDEHRKELNTTDILTEEVKRVYLADEEFIEAEIKEEVFEENKLGNGF